MSDIQREIWNNVLVKTNPVKVVQSWSTEENIKNQVCFVLHVCFRDVFEMPHEGALHKNYQMDFP